jgi:hypothetical protein
VEVDQGPIKVQEGSYTETGSQQKQSKNYTKRFVPQNLKYLERGPPKIHLNTGQQILLLTQKTNKIAKVKTRIRTAFALLLQNTVGIVNRQKPWPLSC